MSLKIRLLPLIFASLIGIVSCATRPPIHVEINGFSPHVESETVGQHFFMLPASKDVSPTGLEFEEYSRYVSNALVQRGYVPAQGLSDADVVIFVGYGIGDPKDNQYAYSMPIYGQTGIQSSSTYGTINSFGGLSTYSGTTTYVPTYGITGFETIRGSYRTYFRYLTVDAYDYAEFKKDQKLVELWLTQVTSTGSINDLRYIMPFLVTAATPYLGVDTEHKIKVTMKDDDTTVQSVVQQKK